MGPRVFALVVIEVFIDSYVLLIAGARPLATA
jgi:hypothetical protein